MNKEELGKLYSAVQLDLENLQQELNRQQLMGGIKPEHLLKYLDIKTNIAISIGMSLLETIINEDENNQKILVP